jgi:pyruvate/2-oxoglutarate dehydrogenase complex dihydrolipoamide dehydrogenase (E3) component
VSGKSGDSVSVVVEQSGVEKVLKGSHVLVATGRKPNTEGLDLELTGVDLTDRGYIKVNERLQTTAPGVWAIGEVAGSPQFTHISPRESVGSVLCSAADFDTANAGIPTFMQNAL